MAAMSSSPYFSTSTRAWDSGTAAVEVGGALEGEKEGVAWMEGWEASLCEPGV